MANFPVSPVDNSTTRELKGDRWEDEIEISSATMMAVYGWNHPDLVGEMEAEASEKIRELNQMYHQKLNKLKAEQEKEKKRWEIAEMLRWGDLETCTSLSTGELINRPNNCLLRDGTSVSICSVSVRTADGEVFTYNNHICSTCMGNNDGTNPCLGCDDEPQKWMPVPPEED